MSRIYEALRRADLEKEGQVEQPLKLIGPPEDPGLADITPLVTENVVKRHWTPSLEAIPALRERDEVVEQFRGLRSQLAQARQEGPLKTVLISSGMPSEGKSFIALNLAVSLARGSKNRVLLIDGDLRRPTLHKSLGASNNPSLLDYLDGSAELSEVLQYNDAKGDASSAGLAELAFIAAGTYANNSSDLIIGGRLESLILSVAQQFDWILIDSPPVLAVPDAVDIARFVDGVLLVAREAKTPYQVIQRAQAAFSQSRLLGVVLNAAKGTRLKRYHYSTYFRSYYDGIEPSQNSERKMKVRS